MPSVSYVCVTRADVVCVWPLDCRYVAYVQRLLWQPQCLAEVIIQSSKLICQQQHKAMLHT
jgi:hypothetical protein